MDDRSDGQPDERSGYHRDEVPLVFRDGSELLERGSHTFRSLSRVEPIGDEDADKERPNGARPAGSKCLSYLVHFHSAHHGFVGVDFDLLDKLTALPIGARELMNLRLVKKVVHTGRERVSDANGEVRTQ